MIDQLRRADRLAEAFVDVRAGGRDVDVSVARGEHAGRNAGRMVVAGLPRHLVADEPARRLEVEQLNLRLQQRGAHPLPLAGNFALEQRDQDASGGKNTGAEIGDRNAPPPPWREAARPAGAVGSRVAEKIRAPGGAPGMPTPTGPGPPKPVIDMSP